MDSGRPDVELLHDTIELVVTGTRENPRIDFALGVTEPLLGLPRDAIFILTATGRTGGIIAHVLEQFSSARVIRPRARFTGPVAGVHGSSLPPVVSVPRRRPVRPRQRSGPSTDLWPLGVVLVPFTTAFAMIGLLIPLRALDLGASPAIVGALVSAKALAPAIVAMPVGSLVDRIGERAPMIAALTIATLATLVAGAATNIGALLVILLLFGSTHLVFVVCSQRLVSSMAKGTGSERNFGWYTTFQSAGQMIGPIVAGIVLDAASFAAAFAVAAAASLAATAAVARIRTTPVAPSTEPSEAAERDVRRAPTTDRGSRVITDLLANPGFRMAIIVSYAVLLTQSVRQAFLPVYMESLAFSGTLIGVVISALGLTAVLVRPFMASIVRVLGGRSRTLILMVAVIVAGVAATSLSTTFTGLLVATVLVGIGHGITQPLSMATVGDHVVRRHMGFALGVRLTANRVAQLAGPLAIGLLAEVTGVRWTFLMSGALLAVALPVMVAARPAFDASERLLRHDRGEPVEPRTS